MEDLTLVIPAKNEKESLPSVLQELEKYNVNIIIVLEENDIETINSTKKFKCKLVYQKINGYGAALAEGIKNVNTKYFCIFNADGSFNPKELSNMQKDLVSTKSNFVFASRYEKNCSSDDDTIVTYIGNFIFTNIGKLFFNLEITDILYTFVLGKTEDFIELNIKSNDFCFCIELPIKAKFLKKKMITSKSHERARIGGKKKVKAFRDGLLILIGMIKLFFKRK